MKSLGYLTSLTSWLKSQGTGLSPYFDHDSKEKQKPKTTIDWCMSSKRMDRMKHLSFSVILFIKWKRKVCNGNVDGMHNSL